ncbi:MAG: sulfatase, partial [Planctomycetaceae bacterium]
MHRFSFLIVAMAAMAGTTIGAEPQPKRPNVVLFVADDMGKQLGCYGDKLARTPAIDQLATEGTRYTRACCTTASCSPSRGVILTGRFGHATGQYGLQHSYHRFQTIAELPTLPVLLSEAGYRVCSIGKVHVEPEKTFHFDSYHNEKTQGHRNPVAMAANAREWIAEKDNRPFFLYFCPSDPHRAAAGFANKPRGGYPGVTPERFRAEEMIVPPWLPDLPEVKAELAEYYESIARVDQGLAALIKGLKETGHWDDTILIVTSDNGPPFPGAKTTLYQPGIELPLIVRVPGQTDAAVCDARVSFVDITPTILEYCGAQPKTTPVANRIEKNAKTPVDGTLRPSLAPFHGRSFRETVGRSHVEGWDELYASHT